jgi:hypothetical protein
VTDRKTQPVGTVEQPVYYVDTHPGLGPVLYRSTDRHPYPVLTHAVAAVVDAALWQVAVGVLTQNAYTVERVAEALANHVVPDQWRSLHPFLQDGFRHQARAALAGIMPARCLAGCRRIIPNDEAVAGFDTCEHCTSSDTAGTQVAR